MSHADTYVDGQVHTNGLENFWALLKRGLGGTYVSVRPFHLFRYLDEQVYRYNAREGEDRARFEGVLEMASGRRITWKELTGRELPTSETSPPAPRHRRRVYPTRPFRELGYE